MRISDWSSDVCSSDLLRGFGRGGTVDGVVEQDVDPSTGGKSRINHVADLFFDADVDLECNRITSEPTDLLGHLRTCELTASRGEDMGALFADSHSGCGADSVSGTRYDGRSLR